MYCLVLAQAPAATAIETMSATHTPFCFVNNLFFRISKAYFLFKLFQSFFNTKLQVFISEFLGIISQNHFVFCSYWQFHFRLRLYSSELAMNRLGGFPSLVNCNSNQAKVKIVSSGINLIFLCFEFVINLNPVLAFVKLVQTFKFRFLADCRDNGSAVKCNLVSGNRHRPSPA